MKLYLDDIRSAPKGWVQCRWPDEVIECIEGGNVEEISLDHDLGDGMCSWRPERTGMDVLNWLETQQHNNPRFPIPIIHIHTSNAAKYPIMVSLAEKLMKQWREYK
jgi:hypothetical protein